MKMVTPFRGIIEHVPLGLHNKISKTALNEFLRLAGGSDFITQPKIKPPSFSPHDYCDSNIKSFVLSCFYLQVSMLSKDGEAHKG